MSTIKDMPDSAKQEEKIKVAVLGGDDRELYLMQGLLDWGFEVAAFAQDRKRLPQGVEYKEGVYQALLGASAVVLPMPGIKNNGQLYCPNASATDLTEIDFAILPHGTPIFVGVASLYLHKIAEKYHLQLFPMAESDEIAVPNSVPTAEGAMALAISNSSGTLDGSLVLVIGYGRVGKALTPRLVGMGSNVFVVNRGAKRALEAKKDGFALISWDRWLDIAKTADYIFNTAPTFLLSREVIEKLKKDTLIIDLAASPGGTDFAAAEKIGIKALAAPGLPGIYAPRKAGKILAEVYPPLIKEKVTAARRCDYDLHD